MSDQAIDDDPDTMVGAVVGERYRIERKLGEGGMGTVYAGTHLGIGKEVAIKCLNPEMVANKAIVERFKREARAATAAGNEHIVDVTDMGELPDGSPFIVMELMKGRELAELLAEAGPLPTGRAVRIMLQICDALAAAHAKGIVHRDMKPENVFLVDRKRDTDFVKVLDFGIARFNEPATIGGGKNLTATGMTMGTPHYMSSEQAQGLAGLDHRTDVYALGVILYEMLAGETPFNAETFPLLVIQIATADPPLLRDRRPDLPIDLEALIMRCLTRDLTFRVQTVEELARGLEPYADLDAPPEVAPRAGELATMRPPGKDAAPKRDVEKKTAAAKPAAHAESKPPPVASPTEMERGISRPSRLPWVTLAVGIVLASAGAVAWAVSAPETDEPGAVVDDPAEAPVPPVDETPVEAPAETAPADGTTTGAAAEVRLQILVNPAEAKIFLDDVEFPNPLDSQRPRSLDPVRLRIECEGFETHEGRLVLDRDRQVLETLERARRPAGGMAGARPTPMSASTEGAQTTNTMTTDMAAEMTTAPPTMDDGFRDDM